MELALNNLAFPADESDYAEDQSVVDGIIQTMMDSETKAESEEVEEQQQQQEQEEPAPPRASTVKEEDKQQAIARQKRRTRIAMEILSTERTYVQNLIVLVKRFLNPLTSTSKSSRPVIKPEQIKTVGGSTFVAYQEKPKN